LNQKDSLQELTKMKNRALSAVALVASLMLLLAIPAQAGPVEIGDVVQVVSGSQRNNAQNASVSLRYLAQDDNATAGTTTSGKTASGTATGDASSSNLVTAVQDPSSGALVQIDTTEDIGVEECECGPFEVPVAGFPKWPFVPLVGLVCLVPDLCTKCTPGPGQDENCREVVCTTGCCSGNCGEVPEPASLLLFGSGIAALGASLRRRYAQAKEIKDQAANISGS
jgi:PEP-CTERM motif